MRRTALLLALAVVLLAGCQPLDLNAPAPAFETGANPDAWALIPAGEFLAGQERKETLIAYDYEMMVTDVTAAQYAAYLNQAVKAGGVRLDGEDVVGDYSGDVFHAGRHELEIKAGEYLHLPLVDPSQKIMRDGMLYVPRPGWEDHPMTVVTWFGAKAFCEASGWRLPTELEWEKAARGADGRAYPWGEGIQVNQANFYASRDPFEDMNSFGSRTTPVGFYNGQVYGDFQTGDGASPYGLYDMAGNVWQWMGNIYEGQHYRYMRGGSKDTYGYNLRVWMRNNAAPEYASPGVGFRCARQ